MTPATASSAKKRWALLADAIISKKVPDISGKSCSVRRFGGYNLFETESVSADGHDAVIYRIESGTTASLVIRLPPRCLKVQDLMGFDNTGNICMWPAEEVMAYYCSRNRLLFRDKQVCELGAGSSGLAGLVLAATGMPSAVMLTDGNNNSVEALHTAINDNKWIEEGRVLIKRLVWDQPFKQGHGSFHIIISADCLYFKESHAALLSRVDELLLPDGVALFFAPRRGDTQKAFVHAAHTQHPNWQVEVVERHDEVLWEAHLKQLNFNDNYDADIHYPILVKIRK